MIFRYFYRLFSILLVIFLASCHAPKKLATVKNGVEVFTAGADSTQQFSADELFFLSIFSKYPGMFDAVIKNRSAHNLQIIYTQVDRMKDGSVYLTDRFFNFDKARYFYPASTVKLPVVLLALQKINELKSLGVTPETAMITEAAYSGQSAQYNEPNSKNGSPSVAGYAKKILLVSDNEAFNRLYEFAGQQYINDQLHNKGFAAAEIIHRLTVPLSEDENRHTNPVMFFDTTAGFLYRQPMLFSARRYPQRVDFMGTGYYRANRFLAGPMDFSGKNRLPLRELHEIVESVVFPGAFSPAQRFNIAAEDRLLVLKSMSQFPRESGYPYYDSSYDDGYAKHFLFDAGEKRHGDKIRIFSKSGTSYGQLTDAAYIIDKVARVEFFLSATIYCNSDGILNDDKYDYQTIGYPFLKNLAKAMYEHELTRKRKYLPEFRELDFSYDK